MASWPFLVWKMIAITRWMSVRAGDAIHEEMERLSLTLKTCLAKTQVRIGVNSGKVIVGSIGIRGMQKLAAIGDAVNSRHESKRQTNNLEHGT